MCEFEGKISTKCQLSKKTCDCGVGTFSHFQTHMEGSIMLLFYHFPLSPQSRGSCVAGGLGSPHVRQHPGLMAAEREEIEADSKMTVWIQHFTGNGERR